MSAIAFWVLLIDGALAIWLGQVSGRTGLVVVGVVLLAAAAAVPIGYRRWRQRLAEVDAARAELRAEIGRLKAAADAARGRHSGA